MIDIKAHPRNPEIVKVIEDETVAERTGYSALGSSNGEGPGGIFMMDHESFEIKKAWELDRGSQHLSYDFFWHLGHDTMITSEWGTPSVVTKGLNPELLLAGKYGHAIHVWDLRKRRHKQALDLGSVSFTSRAGARARCASTTCQTR